MPEQQSNNQQHFYQPPSSNTSDAEAFAFNFHRLLSSNYFVELVKVTAVHGEEPNIHVDMLPLLTKVDPTGAMIETSVIYDSPVFRLQRGASALVMTPVVGDIGLALICDGDTTIVRANREPSVPGGRRRHSRSDAIYLGGVLNGQPSEYIQFLGSEIKVITPGKLTVSAPSGTTFNTPDAHFTGNVTAAGNITDNSGSQSASLKALRDAYDAHKHPVPNVQSGSSTATSNVPDKQV